ncbi:MAG TPA: CARDB domain-containing protein, partial [Pirellulales bacterium]
MQQTSDHGPTATTPATTAKPAPAMVDATTSTPIAAATPNASGTRSVPYMAVVPGAPSSGPSSRRVVDSVADADDATTHQPEAFARSSADAGHGEAVSRNSPRAAAPNMAASIGSPSKGDSASAAGTPSFVKPRTMEFTAKAEAGSNPFAVKADPFRQETAKLESTKSDAIKADTIKSETLKLAGDAGSHKIELSGSELEKSEVPSAAIAPAFSHTPNETVESDDPSAGSGQASSASSGQAKSTAKAGVLFTRQSPLVSVETTGPRSIVIGREATYQITIKNAGDVGAQDLTVSVKIPEWTDIAGSQATAGTTRAAAEANEPFQWKIPKLDAHGKEALSLRLLPRKGRGFDLAVQWTFTPIASQTVVDVQEPKLNMTIAGPEEVIYGQSKVYRLTIANPGTGDAENVVVQLEPIGNSTAPPTRHPIGTIRAGDSKVVELELTARQTGSVSIRASATAEPSLTAEAAQDVLVRRAAVALSVDGAKSRYAGTPAAYAIKITNPGNATAENVHVTATLPAGAKLISASSGGQWKPEQGKVVWSLPPLHAGGDTALELKCTLANPGPNRLQIASSASGDVSDAAAITTNVEALADLKLDVSEPAGPIGVGDEVNYELRIHNRGSKAAEAVAVVVYFSDGIEPESAMGAPSDISNGVVAFRPLAMVPAGGEISLKVKARAQHNGKQVFRAEVECGTLGTKLVNSQEMTVYSGDGGPV